MNQDAGKDRGKPENRGCPCGRDLQAAGRFNRTRLLLFLNFFLFSMVLYLIPTIGSPLMLMALAFAYAFYSFEWGFLIQVQMVVQELDVRLQGVVCVWAQIEYFERRWSYFLGFGLPCASLTFFFPQFIGAGIFALVFPLVRKSDLQYIVMADEASEPTEAPFRLRVFIVAEWGSLLLIRLFRRKRASK